MFESIQDYLCNEIDKETLLKNILNSEKYTNSNDETKHKLDLFVEELKDTDNEEKFVQAITNMEFFYSIDVAPDEIEIFNLATRTCGGIVPFIEPIRLLSYLNTAIEKNDDERVFRLVYNYDGVFNDKSKVEDYYIKTKNAFYINELACNDLTNINTDKLANSLIDIGNIEELKYFANNVYDKKYNKQKIIEKIIELESKS